MRHNSLFFKYNGVTLPATCLSIYNLSLKVLRLPVGVMFGNELTIGQVIYNRLDDLTPTKIVRWCVTNKAHKFGDKNWCWVSLYELLVQMLGIPAKYVSLVACLINFKVYDK